MTSKEKGGNKDKGKKKINQELDHILYTKESFEDELIYHKLIKQNFQDRG